MTLLPRLPVTTLVFTFCLLLTAHGNAQDVFFSFVDDLFGNGNSRDPFEERMETERHDFTQSTRTVGNGVFQIESGYTFFYKDDGEEIEKSNTTPEMLLRLGISDDIEFRFRYNHVWASEKDGGTESGAEDIRFGIKLRTTEQMGWIPESAVEILCSAPTGSTHFTSGKWSPGLDYIFGWKLTEKLELYGSHGVFSNGIGDYGILPEISDDSFTVFSKSVALGYEMTEKSTIFYEFYGLFTKNHKDDPNPVFFNIGVDYYLSDNALIDFRVGKGLNNDADDFFAGFGGGIRF